MGATDNRAAGLELAFSLAQRYVEEQARALENLRARTALLFSAGGVVAGLLGGRLADQPRSHLTPWGWVALVIGVLGFLVLVFVTVALWRPVDLRVNQHPTTILSECIDVDPPRSIDEIHHHLTVHRHHDIEANREVLDRRTTWFRVGLFAFPLEVIMLLAALIDAAR